ncbi:putative defense protein 3 [Callorhinchus milii]|uniref:putative defense protein 3 n=1 Tax=Callorhinchus milii TaxID=7868 RepID=UPI001C3F727D|nr:putative defense protein 3 [Callorhinchus milii]
MTRPRALRSRAARGSGFAAALPLRKACLVSVWTSGSGWPGLSGVEEELFKLDTKVEQFPSLITAFPNGAPTSACKSMKPIHSGVVPQSSRAPYTIDTATSVYQPGKAVQVAILGPHYRGVLLEARRDGDPTPIGSWQNPHENTKLLQCSENPMAAVTHSNINAKSNSTTYVWIPPDSFCSTSIRFMATVAQSREVYWLNVQSRPLMKDLSVACGEMKFTYGIGNLIVTLFVSLLVT